MTRTIIIADDHPLFRQALRETISPVLKGFEVCELESLSETKAALLSKKNTQTHVSLLLLDLRMPDSDGLSGLMMLKGEFPELPIIIISASEEPKIVRAAIQAGASGYMYKSFSQYQIHNAIELVSQGGISIPENIDMQVMGGEIEDLDMISKIAGLTAAQLRIFVLLSSGLMNKQIASEIFISEATVKAHITAIYKQLNVRSRSQAVKASMVLDAPETPIIVN